MISGKYLVTKPTIKKNQWSGTIVLRGWIIQNSRDGEGQNLSGTQ